MIPVPGYEGLYKHCGENIYCVRTGKKLSTATNQAGTLKVTWLYKDGKRRKVYIKKLLEGRYI